MRLDRAGRELQESSLHETLAFVHTFHERLQHVLFRTSSAWLSSGAGMGVGAVNGGGGMSGWGDGWKRAGRGGAGDAALGNELSLALLEEAKLWTAILLRLARMLPLWKAQV